MFCDACSRHALRVHRKHLVFPNQPYNLQRAAVKPWIGRCPVAQTPLARLAICQQPATSRIGLRECNIMQTNTLSGHRGQPRALTTTAIASSSDALVPARERQRLRLRHRRNRRSAWRMVTPTGDPLRERFAGRFRVGQAVGRACGFPAPPLHCPVRCPGATGTPRHRSDRFPDRWRHALSQEGQQGQTSPYARVPRTNAHAQRQETAQPQTAAWVPPTQRLLGMHRGAPPAPTSIRFDCAAAGCIRRDGWFGGRATRGRQRHTARRAWSAATPA